MFLYMYVCMYVYIYVCMYVYIDINLFIYTCMFSVFCFCVFVDIVSIRQLTCGTRFWLTSAGLIMTAWGL